MNNFIKENIIDFCSLEYTTCHEKVLKTENCHIDIDFQKLPNVISGKVDTIYVSISCCFLLDKKKLGISFKDVLPSSKTKEYAEIKKNQPFLFRLKIDDNMEYVFLAIKLI